jgi:hypothetical protein
MTGLYVEYDTGFSTWKTTGEFEAVIGPGQTYSSNWTPNQPGGVDATGCTISTTTGSFANG